MIHKNKEQAKNKERFFAVALLLSASLLLSGLWRCAHAGLFSSTETLRYRVTVAVETPEGLKVGSAVREAGMYHEERILPGQGGTTYNVLKGEAVVVNLEKRGVLFFLIGLRGHQSEAEMIFANMGNKNKIMLTQDQYGDFVRFRDMNDPKTIENVCKQEDLNKIKRAHPYRSVVSFEDAFGSSVSVRGISVEITDHLVTWKIEKYLPWLKNTRGYISGKSVASGREWYKQLSSDVFLRRLDNGF